MAVLLRSGIKGLGRRGTLPGFRQTANARLLAFLVEVQSGDAEGVFGGFGVRGG